jgi:hypothetical protein
MKTIQLFQFWVNGKTVTASIFQLSCDYDNLINCAIFKYTLFDSNLLELINGSITMIEPYYSIDWATNNAAYLWAATQLGLTITGEYNPA